VVSCRQAIGCDFPIRENFAILRSRR
jgi:hypothetical protein